MNIPQFSLKHRPVIWLLLFMISIAGIYNYFTMSQREDPEFKISVALIVTIWPGAGAEKVESLVTRKLEDKFEEISVVNKITSTTRESLSVILIDVDYEADVDIVWQKVRNKIDEVRDELPNNVIGPDVIDDFGDLTAMIYSFSSERADMNELKKYAENLRTELKKLEPVGKVELLGELKEAIYIEGPLESFSMFDFSPYASGKFIDYQNVNMPAGYARTADRKYRLEVSGSFKLEEQLAEAVLDVSKKSGVPLKVKDVFSVRRAFKEPPLDYMLADGHNAIGLDVRMKKGYNLVEMGRQVREAAETFRATIPSDIRMELQHDQPRQVGKFVDSFMDNLFEGLVIVILVMFVSMGFRSAAMIALALPLSIIMTFAVLPLMDVDLETVSIAAFIIALGMLVDNAIIITDNIDVKVRQGKTLVQAACEGAQELVIPVITGTLATVFAFMPLLTLPNETGDYIRSLPIVVSVSLFASLVLAMTISPILAVMFMKPAKPKAEEITTSSVSPRDGLYRRMMGWCLRHRYLVAIVTLLVFIGSLMLIPVVGFSFFPEAERDQFTIDVWLPEGSSIEHTRRVVGQVEGLLRSEEQVKDWVTYVGKGGPRFYMTIIPEFNATNYAQFMVNTKDPRKTRALVDTLNEKALKNIAEARVFVHNLWMGVPVEAPIAIRISGPDLTVAKEISYKLQNIMNSTEGAIQVRDNVGEWVPSLKVNVDSEAAAMMGLTNTEVAVSLLTAYEGLPITNLREGEDEVPVYMRLIESERNMGDTFNRIYVPSSITGKKIPLPAFAEIETDWSPGVIKRANTRRSVTALAGIHGAPTGVVQGRMQARIDELEKSLPPGYAFQSVGEDEERDKNFKELLVIFVEIIMLIMLMLVIQFNSFKKAIVILMSVPLAIIGAVWGLYASGNSFAFMPFLGVISLAGMVIKNAVVWVEFVEKSVEEGNRLSLAIIEAGRQRLRPIMLTAATTVGGLIPLALFGGELWDGMAWAMICGLTLATVLTLVIIPVFFYMAFKKQYADSEKVSAAGAELEKC